MGAAIIRRLCLCCGPLGKIASCEKMSNHQLLLGKSTSYYEEYNPSVLFPIARNQGRSSLMLPPFTGYDLWRIYELTFLLPNGLPQAYMATIKVPCTSPYIVESKSLKLYLGSLCQTMFGSPEEVSALITHDLVDILDAEIEVKLYPIGAKTMPLLDFDSPLLEGMLELQDLKFKTYEVDPSLLKLAEKDKKDKKSNLACEAFHTNLFRSLCPVTGQPDYASIEISYTGDRFDKAALLAYLVSYRRHQGFHEQCVERIFTDIKSKLKPDELTVTACFIRRGGIDISPVRSNAKSFSAPLRTPRQ